MRPSLEIVKNYFKVLFLFFLVFQISRLYFVVYNYDLLQGHFFLSWAQSVWYGFRLDLSACAYCMAPLIIIWLVEIMSGKKMLHIQKTLVIICLILIVLITLTDAELFRKWGNKFNSQVLVYITHPVEMALSAGTVNWIKTLGFALVVLLICRKIYKTMGATLKDETIPKKTNIVLLFLLAGIDFIIMRGGVGVATISQSSAIYSDRSIDNAAAVNSLWNAVYFISSNTKNIYGENLNYLSEREATNLFNEQMAETKDTVSILSTKRPNVIIVMLESLTANASQYFTGNNNCTPYLDSIAGQGLSFMQCYASGDRTEKGLVSVLSGYPAQPSSSIIVFPDKMTKLPSLSKTLKKEGYTNLYFYGGDAEFASMRSYLIVHQFDEIIDKQNFETKELSSKWGAHDEHLYTKALNKLNTIKKPFFSTIMTLSSHEPFDVPYKDPKLKNDEWYGLKNSIEYADKCLFRFLENCKKESWFNETIIVLVADHGHDIGLENVHYFGPEKYHIPLILTGGALKKEYMGQKIENVISQTVIPALLLSQMGLPTTAFNWQKNAFNADGFAQYEFNNGFGRVARQQQSIFDNDSKKCYFYKGDKKDSTLFLDQGKAFQQQLVKDFLSK